MSFKICKINGTPCIFKKGQNTEGCAKKLDTHIFLNEHLLKSQSGVKPSWFDTKKTINFDKHCAVYHIYEVKCTSYT